MPEFPSLHHVALSVTDLDVSLPWYQKLIGAEPAMSLHDGPFARQVFALPGGQLLGLTQHDAVSGDDRFDPVRPGLDHLGFTCADRAEVAAWQTHLDQIGVEHSGIAEADYGWALSFKDPDGNALEFFALASG
jgi:glyoxylase I family protein